MALSYVLVSFQFTAPSEVYVMVSLDFATTLQTDEQLLVNLSLWIQTVLLLYVRHKSTLQKQNALLPYDPSAHNGFLC